MMTPKINGPIPGENMLSDRRNYPWHRAPEYDNTNEAMEYLLENLGKKQVATSVLTLLEIGMPIRTIVQVILMKGIEQGKWTMDLALLLAGPFSHMLVIIARNNDLDYDLGVNDNEGLIPTLGAFKKLNSVSPKNQKETEKQIEEEVIAPMSFMSGTGGETTDTEGMM